MVVQDPPMAILTDVGEDCKYDKSKFREYTKTGQFIDYIVWPAVLIQEGGNMMAKGVAQFRGRVAEAHDEYESDRVVTDEEKSTQEEKLVCNTDITGKDFQTIPVNTDDVELQFEPNESNGIDIRKIERENGLPMINVYNENAKDESGNHDTDQTDMEKEVGADTNKNGNKDLQIQLGDGQSEKLCSASKDNNVIAEIEDQANNSIQETNETADPDNGKATENENGASFSELISDNTDQVCKTDKVIEIQNKLAKPSTMRTENNSEQISTEICDDHENDKDENQPHLANSDKIVTAEHHNMTTDENDDKQQELLSTITASDNLLGEFNLSSQTREVVISTPLSKDQNQSNNESDSMLATDINAEEATRFQDAHTVNIVEPESIAIARVIVLPNATIESGKSPSTKEENSDIVSEVSVDNQNGRIETNMKPGIEEDKGPVAESYVDDKVARNETTNNNTSTASDVTTK